MPAIELSDKAHAVLRQFMQELLEKLRSNAEWTGTLDTTYGNELLPQGAWGPDGDFHEWNAITYACHHLALELAGSAWNVRIAHGYLAVDEIKEPRQILALHPADHPLDRQHLVSCALAGVTLFTLQNGCFVVLRPASPSAVHMRRERAAAQLRIGTKHARHGAQLRMGRILSEDELAKLRTDVITQATAALAPARGMVRHDIRELIYQIESGSLSADVCHDYCLALKGLVTGVLSSL